MVSQALAGLVCDGWATVVNVGLILLVGHSSIIKHVVVVFPVYRLNVEGSRILHKNESAYTLQKAMCILQRKGNTGVAGMFSVERVRKRCMHTWALLAACNFSLNCRAACASSAALAQRDSKLMKTTAVAAIAMQIPDARPECLA